MVSELSTLRTGVAKTSEVSRRYGNDGPVVILSTASLSTTAADIADAAVAAAVTMFPGVLIGVSSTCPPARPPGATLGAHFHGGGDAVFALRKPVAPWYSPAIYIYIYIRRAKSLQTHCLESSRETNRPQGGCIFLRSSSRQLRLTCSATL